jgi:TolA-binding protein
MLLSLSAPGNTVKKDAPAKDNAGDDLKKEFRNIVRMKIDKKKAMNENEENKTSEKASLPYISADIKPALKEPLPDSSETPVDVDKLSPEEAFMLGRIRQAKEINDYSTGITLANQFLNKFPESALRETVAFWRGDFYYDKYDRVIRAWLKRLSGISICC